MSKYIDVFDEIEARRHSMQPYTPKVLGDEKLNFYKGDLLDLRLDEDGDPCPLAFVAPSFNAARRNAKETPQ